MDDDAVVVLFVAIRNKRMLIMALVQFQCLEFGRNEASSKPDEGFFLQRQK